MTQNILKNSIQSAYYNVIFQIFCRLFTFAINTFLIRIINKDFLGIINVRLLLLESTLIFLSREPINRAALSFGNRDDKSKKYSWAQIVNQIWLTVPICVTLTLPCLYVWLKILSPVDDYLYEQYRHSCISVALSCILLLCAELPSFICQLYCFIRLKVFFESLLLFVRSFIFVILALKYPANSIYAFGIAQLAGVFTVLIGYYIYFYFYLKKRKTINNSGKQDNDKSLDDFPFQNIKEMFPGMMKNKESIFNSQLQKLTLSFVKQSILKQILTEGEKYVMSISPVLTFSEQAVYDTVNNLGSLAARFIFRPVEDSSYFYFTQTIIRDIDLDKQNKEKVHETNRVLMALCKTVTSIGLLAFTFAQSYSKTVLLLYCGKEFLIGGLPEYLLKYHSIAIYFLAINGITECFMFATNKSEDINRYNYFMGIYSLLFLFFSYFLTLLFGPVGFILANCINMFLRILHSSVYIFNKFRPINLNPLEGLIPGKLFLLSLFVAGFLCKVSEIKFAECCIIYHIIIGAVAVAICLLCWLFENKEFIKLLYQKYKTKAKTS